MTPLMTQTLPTIVGAGVISRATDTMFSRKEKEARRRRSTRARTKAKVHRGPRGGKYIIRKGQKVYL